MKIQKRSHTHLRSGIAIVLAIVLLASSSGLSGQAHANDQTWNGPFFGFNAKGTLDVAQQVGYADVFFSEIPGWITPNLAVRVTGGTASQESYLDDWTDETIAAWAGLQESHHLRFIYVVNGNDTPANQRDVIQKWLDAGVQFDFLEMMNEYYLPKYAFGRTDLPEVSQQVTPERYASEILPAFWAELDRFALPYAIIFAPVRSNTGQANENMAHWNDVMLHSVIEAYPERDIDATLHLYTDGDTGSFDYDQIERLRQALPAGRHIAITEAGVINKGLDYAEAGELAAEHYQNIVNLLQTGDYLLDQVLYNASRNNNTADLNPEFSGITPKGQRILQFIVDWLGSPAA